MIKTIETEIERQEGCVKNKSCKNQVRKSNADGTTSFLRPMPGAARMYPETDVPLLKISREIINSAKNNLPKLLSENKSYLKEFGLNDELIKLLLKQNKIQDFQGLLSVLDNPNLVAKTLTIFQKDISNKTKKSEAEINEIFHTDLLESILSEVDKKISENDVKGVMQKIVEGQTLEQAIKKQKVNLKEEIENLIKEKPGLSDKAYMGLLMAKFRGQVGGNEVIEELNKQLGEK